jgi:hypothetical protein
MSAADRFAEETTTAATALHAVHLLLAGAAPDSAAAAGVQDPSYLAHALTNLRHATAEVEFIAHTLHRRTVHAASNDAYPTAVRDQLTALDADLRNAHWHVHNTWRVLCRTEEHGMAIKAATRGTPGTVTALADRFAADTTTTTNALAAAHTILAGLSQDYYGGHAVLDAAILLHAVATLREITATLTVTLRVLGRHVSHAARWANWPDRVRDRATALAEDLTSAANAARGTVRFWQYLEHQALDIQKATQGIAFTL